MSARAIPPVPPPLPQPVSHQPPSWIPWKLGFGALLLAALMIFAECRWLRERQRERSIARANEQVESKIAAARGLLAGQHWNEAIRELEAALNIEGATNRGAVESALEEARRGQAETLLDAAGIALTHHRPIEALRLLRAYLTYPQASRLDRAQLLREELERALSDDEAARLLAGISDEALTVFAERGQLTVDDGIRTAAIHAVFQETLRRNLPAEQRKREAQREVARLTAARRSAEHAQRIARLRDTPAFRAFTTFLAQTEEQLREQQQLALRQDAELRGLFQQLDISDQAEQEQIRADLLGRHSPDDFREQIERKHAEVKRSYRQGTDFVRADAELFDQLVDQEVEKFLKRLRSLLRREP